MIEPDLGAKDREQAAGSATVAGSGLVLEATIEAWVEAAVPGAAAGDAVSAAAEAGLLPPTARASLQTQDGGPILPRPRKRRPSGPRPKT